jgi:glycosyltransferase involved in cell wall biosynthesis
MPNSYSYFKSDIKQWFIDNIPTSERILDVGPGQGTYSELLRNLGYRMDAVEVWAPYVEQFELKKKYDNVYIADIREFNLQDYDFIILGDVLEHLYTEDAQRLIDNMLFLKKKCLVAIPYMMSQDGEEYGNEYETHHQPDLTPDVMLDRYPSLKKIYDNQWYGYYVMKEDRWEKAYVLYGTESYKETIQACVDSIKTVSSIPIIVYMMNSDVDIKGAVTINWKCNVGNPEQGKYINRNSSEIYKILIQRPAIVKDALTYANVVAYVDGDSVATKYIDNIFLYFPEKSIHPYFTEGIYEWMTINGKGGVENRENISSSLEHPACEFFNVDQTIRDRYRQTGYFVAGQWCKEFLDDWWWMCNHPKILQNPQHYAPYHEETIVNVLLWKNKQLGGLPYIYINGSLDMVNNVQFYGYKKHTNHFVASPTKEDHLLFYHGEKNKDVMMQMINKINGKQRILFLAPHMSTGGMPQYLLKKIQTIKNQYDIYLIEYSNASPDYIVQKEQLKRILGNKYYTLHEDKFKIFDIIAEIKPDVIHLEDVPESFMDSDISVQLYGDKNRTYFIVESTHSSLTVPSTLLFHPDKFILPSKWIQQKFTEQLPQIPNDIWEYPIENYYKDQKLAQDLLKLDPKQKHVLMVGLFTPGKNQGEIFEIAKQLPEVQFHFVGNQAPNFAEYWSPLMKNKPNNCVVWGERNDVSTFYQACDLFYFSSKFELMPLSIKEALSYGLPCLFRCLETYMDGYDNNSLVHYIDDNLDKTKQILCTLI